MQDMREHGRTGTVVPLWPTRAFTTVLVVVAPKVGGAEVGRLMATALGEDMAITVVEDTAADPRALADAEVILTALAPVTGEHLAAAEALRFVQCSSHGYDHVDLVGAQMRGVEVATIGSTDAEVHAVAEHTMAMMLAAAKQLVPATEQLRAGRWAPTELHGELTELRGKTLGIVGFGGIGRQVALRARAFGMRVVCVGSTPLPQAVLADHGVEQCELDTALAEADYLSLHLPLTHHTEGLIDARRLASMKRTAILINTARAELVDQHALAAMLERGELGGAGLDVFAPEPPPAHLPLLRAPRVLLTPHIAGLTRESRLRIAVAALDNVRRYASGETPHDLVTATQPW